MRLETRTVLITGGTSGIGLELARQLSARRNTVIITGRDQAKLKNARNALVGVHALTADISTAEGVKALYDEVMNQFTELDVLVNNAGIMRKISLHDETADLENLTTEIDTNLSGLIRMCKQFLPHLKTRKAATIINVSSGLAFVPFPISPVYSAAKAGVHAFTECLRVQLKNTRIEVVELAPPGTETALFRGDFTSEDLGGVTGMAVGEMVSKALKAMEQNRLEIRPGLANVLKVMSRLAPRFILRQLSKPVDLMLKG